MNKTLTQGTIVQFSINNIEMLGSIVGVSMIPQAILGALYIIEPFEQIENYEYSHISLFESWLTVANFHVDYNFWGRVPINGNMAASAVCDAMNTYKTTKLTDRVIAYALNILGDSWDRKLLLSKVENCSFENIFIEEEKIS